MYVIGSGHIYIYIHIYICTHISIYTHTHTLTLRVHKYNSTTTKLFQNSGSCELGSISRIGSKDMDLCLKPLLRTKRNAILLNMALLFKVFTLAHVVLWAARKLAVITHGPIN